MRWITLETPAGRRIGLMPAKRRQGAIRALGLATAIVAGIFVWALTFWPVLDWIRR